MILTPVQLTADIIIRLDNGKIVLVKRRNPPFEGRWALPGGMMDPGERIEETALREAREETGLTVRLQRIVGVYSAPGRDPRGRYVSVAYAAVPEGGSLEAASDASDIGAFDPDKLPEAAFDHAQILLDYFRTIP